jgi:hypothetical protein
VAWFAVSLGNPLLGGKRNFCTINTITQGGHLGRGSGVSLLGIMVLPPRERKISHGALYVLPLNVLKPRTETPSFCRLSGSTQHQGCNDKQPEKPLHLRSTGKAGDG